MACMVLIPYWFWRDVWFGGELSNETMHEYLKPDAKARYAQHALTQFTTRMEQNPAHAKEFYADVVAVARHADAPVRAAAAWGMGYDMECEEFHNALRVLLQDADVMVQYNAALALAKFNDAAACPALRHMLMPYELRAGGAGVIDDVLKPAEPTDVKSRVALLRVAGADPRSVLSPMKGKILKVLVQTGQAVQADDVLCTIQPGWVQIWEALRALYMVGQSAEDLAAVEPYVKLGVTAPANMERQAKYTQAAIQQRMAGAPK